MAQSLAGWTCKACGHEEVDFAQAAPLYFRVNAPPMVVRPKRKGAGVAMTVALLMVAAGLATTGYFLLTDPDAGSLLGLTRATTRGDSGRIPSDYVAPAPVNGMHERIFNWTYAGTRYTWTMNITDTSYTYFRGLDRPERRYQEAGVWHVQPAYDIYVSTSDDDIFINRLGEKLLEIARQEGFSDDEALSFTLAFVQGLRYTSDSVTTGLDEYPRYPVETLVDEGGDCEDTSILYASLVLAMGYGAVMVSPPGHMAVGVAAAESVPGASYTFEGQRYLYAETTGDGYGIGQIPDQYDSDTVDVYDLAAKPLFAMEVEFGTVTRDGKQVILLKATQTGSARAEAVTLKATVGKTGITPYDEAQCEAGDVEPGTVVECRLLLDLNKVPRGARVVVRCFVQDGQYIYDETDSTAWVPRS